MLITRVFGKGIKGQEFDINLAEKNFIGGPNGAGKTTIIQAIGIAINGYMPGVKGKLPGPVMDTFGSGKTMIVGIECGDKTFERKFTRDAKGSVKQTYKVNDRTTKKDEFNAMVYGLPNIMDLGAFMDLSDQKKIDMVFDLFPPAGNVVEIDENILKLTKENNSLEADIRIKKATKAELVKSISSYPLPAGTLAEARECKAGIGEQWKTVSAEIKAEEKRISDVVAAKKLKEENEKARVEGEKQATLKLQQSQQPMQTQQTQQLDMSQEFPGKIICPDSTTPYEMIQSPDIKEPNAGIGQAERMQHMALHALKTVILAMENSGCDFCSAKLVAKKQMSDIRKAVL